MRQKELYKPIHPRLERRGFLWCGVKMYKTWILIILLGMALSSPTGYVKAEEKGKSWKGSVTETDLVAVVNFLMDNKGKEIKLGGKKHTITGKEELDIEITVLLCCDEKAFLKYLSTFGIVKDVKFPTFYATLPAGAIKELDKHGEVTEVKFAPKVKDFWMNAIKK